MQIGPLQYQSLHELIQVLTPVLQLVEYPGRYPEVLPRSVNEYPSSLKDQASLLDFGLIFADLYDFACEVTRMRPNQWVYWLFLHILRLFLSFW